MFLQCLVTMKIRQFIFYSVLLVIVVCLGTAAVFWLRAAPPENAIFMSNYSRFGVGQLLTQIALSILTLAALCWSLCGKNLGNFLHGPELKMVANKDAVHCVLDNDLPTQGSIGASQPILSIYTHVENMSKSVATKCQLISNRVYASVDGESFYAYKRWQTASYKWLYAQKDQPYTTDVRNSVEKYARIVTIVQQETSSASSEPEGFQKGTVRMPSLGDGAKRVEASWFEIQMPVAHFVGREFGIRVSPQYRGILLPITRVCAEGGSITEYIKIVWRGNSVRDYLLPGMLSVEVKSHKEAKKMIRKEFD